MSSTLDPAATRGFETLALHGGHAGDPVTKSRAVPLYQTTSYNFDDTSHAARLFALEEFGNIYTRIMNPTTDVLEQRIARLEGGAAALAVSSGQAASAFAIQNLARAGDNIVSSTDLYGGTWNLFANTLKDQGIDVRFVDPADPEGFARATDARTRAWYAETLPNPKLIVFPIAEVAEIGRSLGVPLIMDNTAAPVLCRPLGHGAAIVVYSTTKYIGGHGTSIGGMIVDGGNFPWEQHSERFPSLNQPDPSYHGAVWVEAAKPLGPVAYILRARTVLLRDLGDRKDRQLRVGQGLGVPGPGSLVAGAHEGFRIGRVDEAHLDALILQGVGEQVPGAAVQVGAGDDVVAGVGQVLHRERAGRLAGGDRNRRGAALERRDAFLEHRDGRVHDPGVNVAEFLQPEQLGRVVAVAELIAGGLVDRHRNRGGGRIAAIPGMQHDRLRMLAFRRHRRSPR